MCQVGWREWVALPEIGIALIKAKIDTGARTSALHAYYVERFRRGGRDRVRFGVHPVQQQAEPSIACELPLLDMRQVTDSGGHREHRCVVETQLRLGADEWRVELTLTARDTMRFRMLLGRTAMRDRLCVLPSASYLCGQPAGERTP